MIEEIKHKEHIRSIIYGLSIFLTVVTIVMITTEIGPWSSLIEAINAILSEYCFYTCIAHDKCTYRFIDSRIKKAAFWILGCTLNIVNFVIGIIYIILFEMDVQFVFAAGLITGILIMLIIDMITQIFSLFNRNYWSYEEKKE